MNWELTDLELARASKTDPAAFGLLYRKYADNVYRYVAVRVPSPEDAEDITAQVFEGAMNTIHSYRGDAGILTWFIQIARFRISDFYRKRNLDESEATVDDSIQDSRIRPDDLGLVTIQNLLGRLERQKAEVVEMKVFAGLGHDEIASMLGKSVEATRAIYSRALKQLRKIVEEEEIYHHEWFTRRQ